jgi:hypothetical protein
VCGDLLRFSVEGFWVVHFATHHRRASGVRWQVAPVLFAHGGQGGGGIFDVYVDPVADVYRLPLPWSFSLVEPRRRARLMRPSNYASEMLSKR